MNGKSLSVILKRLTTIPTITERTGENAMMLKTNKKNLIIGTFAQSVRLTCLYKDIAFPVWTKKNLNVTKFFLRYNPNLSDFSKQNAKNYSDQN